MNTLVQIVFIHSFIRICKALHHPNLPYCYTIAEGGTYEPFLFLVRPRRVVVVSPTGG